MSFRSSSLGGLTLQNGQHTLAGTTTPPRTVCEYHRATHGRQPRAPHLLRGQNGRTPEARKSSKQHPHVLKQVRRTSAGTWDPATSSGFRTRFPPHEYERRASVCFRLRSLDSALTARPAGPSVCSCRRSFDSSRTLRPAGPEYSVAAAAADSPISGHPYLVTQASRVTSCSCVFGAAHSE